jgi:nitronate monooxygenase
VLDAVDVPVLAAGGIADGRALAAVLAAGASGARLGTRFVATLESGAHPQYKRAVVDAGADATAITDAFAVCPLCATSPRARVIRRCIDAVHDLGDQPAGQTTMGGESFTIEKGSGLPPGASATGQIDAMAMYAGESATLVTTIDAAAQVIEDLTATARDLLDRW